MIYLSLSHATIRITGPYLCMQQADVLCEFKFTLLESTLLRATSFS